MIKLNKIDCYKLASGMIFKSPIIKNGLDTSRLVNLIICIKDPEKFRIEGFSSTPNMFFIHEISFSEAVGILINKFNFSKEQAISEVKKWKKEFQTNEIKKENVPNEYEKIVERTNNQIVKELGKNYQIGYPDVIIIAGFIKERINIIHVKDKGFEETCKRLNINVIATPQKDIELEKKIKKGLIK